MSNRAANKPTECLFEVADNDLRTLSDMYRNNEQNPCVTSLIDNGFRIREMVKGYPMRFASPLASWRDTGTFISSIEFDRCVEVGVYTLHPDRPEESANAVFSGLMFTKRVNFDSARRPVVFKEIHEGLMPVVRRVIKRKRARIAKEERCRTFKMIKEEALQFEISVPDEENVEVKPLSDVHAFAVLGNWPHGLTGEDVPRTLIDVNGGYGAFTGDGQLASWALKTMAGQVGFVQTAERYQRRGFASAVVKTLCKELASEGVHPCAVVRADDAASHNFFDNLGFKAVNTCYDVYLRARSEDEGAGSSRT
ncbi:unnamed protein product [Phyllotreta striolata]|uniref:N-acetyltransferase domain-containing protein n=1 Tax=Phyllotreta striolata TaxID=444603 RepID=A0A9N9XQD2_PHYSR|nr:unnamed protein product [Phyllotreta striolata]